MPKFKIFGFSKLTGRHTRRTYSADSKEQAFEQAFNDQIIVDVDATQIIPDKPATDKQLRFAGELGVVIPAGASSKQASEILTQALTDPQIQHKDDSLPPTEAQLEMAKELRIKNAKYMTRRRLSYEIDRTIERGPQTPLVDQLGELIHKWTGL
jgi:hypothetical protein